MRWGFSKQDFEDIENPGVLAHWLWDAGASQHRGAFADVWLERDRGVFSGVSIGALRNGHPSFWGQTGTLVLTATHARIGGKGRIETFLDYVHIRVSQNEGYHIGVPLASNWGPQLIGVP